MKDKSVPNIYVRGKYAYKLAGHFFDKLDATIYKNQTLHSLMLVRDNPEEYGVGVKYHVYRRLV